jgi:hypothetical protein
LEITIKALSGIADIGQIPANKPEFNKFTGPIIKKHSSWAARP